MPAKNITLSFSYDDSSLGVGLHFINDKLWIYTNDEIPQPYPDGWLGAFFDNQNPPQPVTQSNLSALVESIPEFVEKMASLTGVEREPVDGTSLISFTPLKIIRFEFHLPNVVILSNLMIDPLPDAWRMLPPIGGTTFAMAVAEDIEEWLDRILENPI